MNVSSAYSAANHSLFVLSDAEGEHMHGLLKWIARVAAIVGIAVMGIAVMGRLLGAFWLGSFQVGTLLQAGMAALLIACLAYLAVLAERR
jgi:hypothetical protein